MINEFEFNSQDVFILFPKKLRRITVMVLNRCKENHKNEGTNLFEKYLLCSHKKQTQINTERKHWIWYRFAYFARRSCLMYTTFSTTVPMFRFPFCGQIKWICFYKYMYSVNVLEMRENGVTWKTSLRIQQKSINGILNFQPLIDLHSHIDECI